MRSLTLRRLAPWPLAIVLLASQGCRDDAESPTGPGLDAGPVAPTALGSALPVFTAISAGGAHTCALDGTGTAWCWGSNSTGQLGAGGGADRANPVKVAGTLRFLQISAGAEHTCAIATNERAYCWGRNHGRLGDGTSFDRDTPTAVAGNRRFRNVNAGNDHTCAVNPFDVAFCWGNNNYGQLGTGGGFTTTPVRVAGGHQWRRVSAGGQLTCGVRTDDRAYCWGFRAGTKPAALQGGLLFKQVVAGGGGYSDAQHQESEVPHACGIGRDDRAYCWGNGDGGELGHGQWVSSASPVAVSGTRRWDQVIAGFEHTCGVTKADVAFCWGRNTWGQNGNGTTNSSNTPVRVSGGFAFANISTGVGGTHACALTGDGNAYCWGNNSSGQLGDGTRSRRLEPVAVVGAT